MALNPSYRVLLRSPLPYAEIARGLHAELAQAPSAPIVGMPVYLQSPMMRGYVRGRLTDAWLHLVPGSRRISIVRLDAELQPSEYGTDVLATLSVRPNALFGPEGTRRISLLMLLAGVLITVLAVVTASGPWAVIGLITVLTGVCALAMLPLGVLMAKQEMSYLENWLGARLHAARYPLPDVRRAGVR